jgi:hypothetical protein
MSPSWPPSFLDDPVVVRQIRRPHGSRVAADQFRKNFDRVTCLAGRHPALIQAANFRAVSARSDGEVDPSASLDLPTKRWLGHRKRFGMRRDFNRRWRRGLGVRPGLRRLTACKVVSDAGIASHTEGRSIASFGRRLCPVVHRHLRFRGHSYVARIDRAALIEVNAASEAGQTVEPATLKCRGRGLLF